jgi:hypothetical protein
MQIVFAEVFDCLEFLFNSIQPKKAKLAKNPVAVPRCQRMMPKKGIAHRYRMFAVSGVIICLAIFLFVRIPLLIFPLCCASFKENSPLKRVQRARRRRNR